MLPLKLSFLFKHQKNGSLFISKFFREIFESKHIRLVLGFNLIVFGVIMSFFGTPTAAFTQEAVVLFRPKDDIFHTETAFRQPVTGYISQGYHWYHPAVDIVSKLGEPIYSIDEGEVKEVIYSKWGYGHEVIIDHEQGLWSLYAHLGEIKVKPGQKIDKNTCLGTVGLTGWTTGAHLHLEIWRKNSSLNPALILSEFESQLVASD